MKTEAADSAYYFLSETQSQETGESAKRSGPPTADSNIGIPPRRTSLQPFPTRQAQKSDLVYGSEEGRTLYIGDSHHLPGARFRIDYHRVLTSEQHNRAVMPAEEEQSFKTSLASHEKYRSALTEDVEHFIPKNSAVRRKCKGGLLWATKLVGKHVHFVLDTLDMQAIVKKSAPPDAQLAIGKYRSITGAELRWLYRNRNDPDVQSHVHFWMEGKPARPPWEQDAPLWAQYVRSQNLSGNAPSPVDAQPADDTPSRNLEDPGFAIDEDIDLQVPEGL